MSNINLENQGEQVNKLKGNNEYQGEYGQVENANMIKEINEKIENIEKSVEAQYSNTDYYGNVDGRQAEKLNGKNENAGYVGTIKGGYIGEVDGILTQKQDASSGVGVLPGVQGGYVGGFIGKENATNEQSDYIGGFITAGQTQNIGYSDSLENTINPKNLPVKIGFWSKVKALFLPKNRELQIAVSPKQVKVLSEVHDFLFQDISVKGFFDILKIGKDKK